MVATLTALLIAAFSPLGHTTEAPRAERVPFEMSRSGACPYDASIDDAPADWCRARWSIGPLTRIHHRGRSLFLLRHEREEVVVTFSVTLLADRACTAPWVDSPTFNEQARRVCLALCQDRIEMRAAGVSHPLVGAGGIAARTDELRCGRTYRGSWTFDVTDAHTPLALHYPGFRDLVLPL